MNSTAARFSPDGRWLTTAGTKSIIWKVQTWQTVNEFAPHSWPAFAHDGRMVAVGDEAGVIRLVEIETNREIARLTGPESCKYQVSHFAADDAKLIASDTEFRRVYVWDLRKIRRQLKEMKLDWDWPELPPDQTPMEPIRLELQKMPIRP